MKLNDYIASTIMAYPMLYCKNTYRKSRTEVLKQLFLVIGNGIDFVPKRGGGYFSERTYRGCRRKQKLNKSDVKRIENSEKIAVVYSGVDEMMAKFGHLYGKLNDREEILFYQDFLDAGKKHLLCESDEKLDGIREPIDTKGHKRFVEVYPRDCKEYNWHPYPFSLKYSSFHDDKTDELIKPSRIADDWREGIVEIFKIAKDWMEDDNCFMADPYFNWVESVGKPMGEYFLKAWNKQLDKLKFCDDYGIERKPYTDPKSMAVDIIRSQP